MIEELLKKNIALPRSVPGGKKIAYLSTYPPRECGIATFTYDLSTAINTLGVFARPIVIAVDNGKIAPGKKYAKEVKFVLDQYDRESYIKAADYVNESGIDFVSLQHEFGIFGTSSHQDMWDGNYILEFLKRVNKPVITTFHTVLKKPNENQKAVVAEIAARSRKIVLMARNVRRILENVYGIKREKMAFIHHGAPEAPFHGSEYFKRVFGLSGREILMTYGLLNRNKGIEHVIRALPPVVASHPETMYLIVGATHPIVRQKEGEKYRRELKKMVRDLGLTGNVKFVNQYLTLNQLMLFLRAANIYLAPQNDAEQYCSGTLSYAAAFGKAVIATKFRHAKYILKKDRGILVPFKDPEAITGALLEILDNPQKKRDMEERIYVYSRKMTWPNVASKYADLFLKSLEEKKTNE